MKTFNNLLKINLSNFASNSIFNKRKKLTTFLYVGLFIFLFAYISVVAYLIGTIIPKNNHFILIYIGSFSTIIFLLINSLLSGSSYIFNTKDDDFLCSLPIKHSTVFLSKLFSLYFLFLLYSVFTYIPFIVSYFIFSNFNIISLVFAFLSFFLLPLFPMVFGTLLNMFVNLFTSTSKLKNIIYYILSIGLLILILITTNMSDSIFLFISNPNLLKNISIVIFPIYFLINSIVKLNVLNFVLLVLISIIPFILFTIICSKFYININSRLQKTHHRKEIKSLKLKTGNQTSALLKKEFRKIFSNANYFFNSCLGPILLFIISIASIFGFKYLIVGNATETEFVGIIAILTTFITLNGPLTVTFSLEGSSFWIYKTLPISPKQIINTKLLSEILLFLPLSIISVILFSVSSKFNVVISILFVLFIIILCVFSSLIHLFIGIKKYNLHYTNETQVIKQSSAVLFSTLFSFVLSFIIVLLYAFIFKFYPFIYYMIGLISLLLISSIIIYINLLKFDNNKLIEIA